MITRLLCRICGQAEKEETLFLKKNDLVEVLQSPGAPFDIGEIFTVADIAETNLPVSVVERPYRFCASWLKRAERGRKVPGPCLTVENGHEVVKGACVNCGSRNFQIECAGARI